jgi:hypothetical protein
MTSNERKVEVEVDVVENVKGERAIVTCFSRITIASRPAHAYICMCFRDVGAFLLHRVAHVVPANSKKIEGPQVVVRVEQHQISDCMITRTFFHSICSKCLLVF